MVEVCDCRQIAIAGCHGFGVFDKAVFSSLANVLEDTGERGRTPEVAPEVVSSEEFDAA